MGKFIAALSVIKDILNIVKSLWKAAVAFIEKRKANKNQELRNEYDKAKENHDDVTRGDIADKL